MKDRCKTDASPMQHQCNYRCKTNERPMQDQCKTDARPMQDRCNYQCKTDARPMQDRCKTDARPMQHRCKTDARPIQDHRKTHGILILSSDNSNAQNHEISIANTQLQPSANEA